MIEVNGRTPRQKAMVRTLLVALWGTITILSAVTPHTVEGLVLVAWVWSAAIIVTLYAVHRTFPSERH
jgi:hypothetical protein